MIKSLIDAAVIIEDLEGVTKKDAFAEILAKLTDSGTLEAKDVSGIKKRLTAREKLGSTGIGNGVAVPHVKDAAVEGMCLVLARSHAGIDFDAIDGKPVHLVFLILAPPDDPEGHLQALRWISSLARNGDFRRFAMQADAATGIRDLLHEMNSGS